MVDSVTAFVREGDALRDVDVRSTCLAGTGALQETNANANERFTRV
jgi:hypothetical protein